MTPTLCAGPEVLRAEEVFQLAVGALVDEVLEVLRLGGRGQLSGQQIGQVRAWGRPD
ncbi:hypothetical protein [Kribbella jiaozuonensis]|uniref:hypothetical protein n=1 Tax=Kribbella jiaozuonensis TaxID=2575441 RepID=UPI001484ECC7|nr:hypothetical protein [Kribbella jiaozuonensis]